jgi:hypothetical protein
MLGAGKSDVCKPAILFVDLGLSETLANRAISRCPLAPRFAPTNTRASVYKALVSITKYKRFWVCVVGLLRH